MREAFNDAMVTGGQELEPGILLPDEGEERTVFEVAVDGTGASKGWYAWSPLAPRGHFPFHQQKQQTVTAAWAGWILLPHRE